MSVNSTVTVSVEAVDTTERCYGGGTTAMNSDAGRRATRLGALQGRLSDRDAGRQAHAYETSAVLEESQRLEPVRDGLDVAKGPLERVATEERRPRRTAVQPADHLTGDLSG